MSSPVVSVCIANYNGMEIIDACLASVFGQQGDIPLEVIVHDDASTDGSAAYIREKYPDVVLIESAENVGFCIANNRMAARARGEYLLLLNNDATLLQDALAVLLDEAVHMPGPAILSLPQYDADTGELLDIGSLLDPFLNPVPNRNPAHNDVGTVAGACLWVPKSLWNKMGGFPEWFGSIGEDLYVCCRARLAGHPVRALGVSGYRHRVGQSFGGGKARGGRLATTVRRRALSERNKTYAMIICQPTTLLIVLLPVHLILIFLEGMLLSAIQRNRRLWQNVYAPLLPGLWAERGRLRASRIIVQSERRITLATWLAPFRWLPWKLQMLLRHGLPEVK